ncbi:MAG: hypothetical protein KC502_22795, partial [Myxococcales bacterium]|nr:hypothetical protein [Myxococcales bacterium]
MRPAKRRLRRAIGLALAALLVMATASISQARPRLRLIEDGRGLLHSYSATMGLIVNNSGDFNSWSTGNPLHVQAMGFRYFERNGFITGTILALMRIFAAAAQTAGPKSQTSWTEGNYRYTRTTYYSQAEKNAINRAASNSATQMLTSPGQSFDLEIYSRNLGGDSSGYKVTMMFGGITSGRRRARSRTLL